MDNHALGHSPPKSDGPLLSQIPKLTLVGAGLAIVAGVTGILCDHLTNINNDWMGRIRNLLACSGVLLVGYTISQQYMYRGMWLIGSVAAFAASFGMVSQWDTFQLLFTVLGFSALFAIVVLSVPVPVRMGFVALWIFFHFGGIFSAISSPPPQPYWSQHMWSRVFRPYLQFMYMNNAYQFYSPDPGPPSELWFCIEYVEKGKGKSDEPLNIDDKSERDLHWVKTPQKPTDFRDPLGLTYYRRLALTEQLAQTIPGTYNFPPREWEEIQQRRLARSDIRLHPNFTANLRGQYRPPNSMTQRILLPSYARAIAAEYARPDKDIRGIKMYRVQHDLVGMKELADGLNPFQATMYGPFFMGEYDTEGKLTNPADPLLYWLIPILLRPGVQPPTSTRITLEEYHRQFEDYVVKHAGKDHYTNLPKEGQK